MKHLARYFANNYNINQQKEMTNKGVLLSYIEKIKFTTENVVLVFNKFEKFDQLDQRKIFWSGTDTQCKKCENLNVISPTFWHRLFVRYINHSVDHIG